MGNNDFLTEVQPAFEKRLKAIALDLSAKANQINILVSEANNLSHFMGYDVSDILTYNKLHFTEEAGRFLKEVINGFYRHKENKREPKDISAESVGNNEELTEEPVNLVTGKPTSKRPYHRKKLKTTEKTTSGKNYTQSFVKKNPEKPSERYRGVLFVSANAKGNQFYARARVKGTNYQLGVFPTAQDAAFAYDEFKFKKTGALKGLNFPDRIFRRAGMDQSHHH